ncbi:MAG TPA: hypothetical protein VK464_14300 [Symbiobacteriaceae bacterium]|nr:hypothetical protein [Symbiobacteriaceae bacterium]
MIATYRPKPGCAQQLEELVKSHVPILRSLNLATERFGFILKSKVDGTMLEIFEWASAEAANTAHHHSAVGEIWAKMEELGSFGTLHSLEEGNKTFPHFDVVS